VTGTTHICIITKALEPAEIIIKRKNRSFILLREGGVVSKSDELKDSSMGIGERVPTGSSGKPSVGLYAQKSKTTTTGGGERKEKAWKDGKN